MTQLYDVLLGATGYMVKPGSYQRYQDGQSEGRVGRVRLFDFYGGAKRAAQMERDRFFTGVGAWPTLDSQGLTSGPKRQDFTDSVSPAITPGNRRWVFPFLGSWYLIDGADLYSVATSGGLYNGLTHVQTLAGTVVDCDLNGDTLWFAYGSTHALGKYDIGSGTYTADALGSTAQFKAKLVSHESGEIRYVRVDEPTWVNNSAANVLIADAAVRRLVQVDGHCWVLTEGTVYRFTSATAGDVTTEATVPRLAAPDDFDWALAHFGRLWTWAGKEIIFYDTAKDTFQGTGVRGASTLGACTVGSWLVAAVVSSITGNAELWAYDGRGWWLLDEQTSSNTLYSYPVSIFGSCDDVDMLAGRGSTSNQLAGWQFFPRSGAPGLRDSYELVTALMDAGERDLDKVWRRAGIELATPDDRATSDTVTVALSYSVDGGATWTQIDSDTLDDTSSRLVTIGGTITARPQGRFIQLKLSVSSVNDWCPVVLGLWTEHETMDLPTRRRRWKFAAICADRVVKRDGSVDATGARDLASALWDAWDDGTTLAYTDVDGAMYTVRISGIREMIGKVSEIELASSDVELTLVEV
jgi:hypothetical protein